MSHPPPIHDMSGHLPIHGMSGPHQICDLSDPPPIPHTESSTNRTYLIHHKELKKSKMSHFPFMDMLRCCQHVPKNIIKSCE